MAINDDQVKGERRTRIGMRAVEALQVGEVVWDTDVAGFGVRCQRRDRVYVLKYRFEGRQRWYSIGRHGSPWTPETARREAKRLLGFVADRRDPAAFRDAIRRAETIGELAARYLSDHAEPRNKPRTVADDRMLLRLQILPAFERFKISDVTRADVARWHRSLGGAPVRANRALALLRAMFNRAEEWGLRQEGTNPATRIERFPEKKRERFLSPQDLARLGDAVRVGEATGKVHPSIIALARLLILTGARRSEIALARWEWVDFERACLRLPDSKTGAKVIPLAAPALAVLARLPRLDDNPYIIVGERPGAPFIGIERAWRRLRDAAGLGDTRLHDLRHSFASVAVAGGDSLYLIGKVLGHRQATTTERYAHLHADPLRALADRTAARIAAMMGDTAISAEGTGSVLLTTKAPGVRPAGSASPQGGLELARDGVIVALSKR